MNTQGHIILNLAILGQGKRPTLTWPIIIGSFLPDAAMFVFYAWARGAGFPDRVIWRDLYYQPFWQDIFAIGNSIPLTLVGLGVALWQRRPRWAALCGSMILHHLEDLPLHHDDAHRHFFPLSDYRFISPVSYWDADHYGAYAAFGEMVLVAIASYFLCLRVRSRWGRGLLIAANLAYLVGYIVQY